MKTIGLSDADHGKVKRYCDLNKLGMGEFVTASLAYFQKNGINPATHESPAAEMNKLIRRLDQVIAFIRKQESDVLLPMVDAVSGSEARVKQSLQQAAKADQVTLLEQSIKSVFEQLGKLIPAHQQEVAATRASTERLLQEHTKRELAAFRLLGKLIDAKEKTNFMNDIGRLYSEQRQP